MGVFQCGEKASSINSVWTETDRRVAKGAVTHTGRMAEEAGHSEGSYQESASNSKPAGQSKQNSTV